MSMLSNDTAREMNRYSGLVRVVFSDDWRPERRLDSPEVILL